MFRDFFKLVASFFPQHGPFVEKGFRAVIENGDLILRKRFSRVVISIHQGVEPFNPRFGDIIDFEIENACVVFEFLPTLERRDKLIDELRELFDYSYFRQFKQRDFLFSMLRDMEQDDPRLVKILPEIEKLCSSSDF